LYDDWRVAGFAVPGPWAVAGTAGGSSESGKKGKTTQVPTLGRRHSGYRIIKTPLSLVFYLKDPKTHVSQLYSDRTFN
jgi:hypothetical protein